MVTFIIGSEVDYSAFGASPLYPTEKHTYTVNGTKLSVNVRVFLWSEVETVVNGVRTCVPLTPFEIREGRLAKLLIAVSAACESLWGPGTLRPDGAGVKGWSWGFAGPDSLEWR